MKMNMAPWERIEAVIEYLKLNKASFSREIGLSNNVTISRIIREKRNVSNKVLRLIVARFPVISYDWLLTGTGKMLTSDADRMFSNLKEEASPAAGGPGQKKNMAGNPYTKEQYGTLVAALKTLVDTNKELVETNKQLVQMLAGRLK